MMERRPLYEWLHDRSFGVRPIVSRLTLSYAGNCLLASLAVAWLVSAFVQALGFSLSYELAALPVFLLLIVLRAFRTSK